MVIDNGAASDHRGHPGDSAHEKVERNLPRPNRRFDHGLAVVTWLARNRAAGNIDTFARNNAILPRLLAQLFEPLFRLRLVRHAIFWGAHASSRAALGAPPNALR